MLASNARLRVGLWQFSGLCDYLFPFFNLSADISYLPSAVCTWLIFPTVVLDQRDVLAARISRSGFRLYCSECERVCMWKCTQARLAVWEVLISDGGGDIGLLSTLRKLGSPEGSFCCINSECYFQFDPNTPPPPPPTPPTFVFSRCPSLSAFVF